jgi:hypothetical protein
MKRQLRTPVRKHAWFTSEWQAQKAARRSLSHDAAVKESAQITKLQWRLMGKMSAAAISLDRIIRALNAKKIPFVLTGAHAIGGWTGRPRATHDVDILVKAGRNRVWSHRHRELCGKTRTGALRGIRTPLLDGRARHAARLRQRTPCQIGRERFLPNPAQLNHT